MIYISIIKNMFSCSMMISVLLLFTNADSRHIKSKNKNHHHSKNERPIKRDISNDQLQPFIITSIKSDNITQIAIYSGMMKIIHSNMVNPTEILFSIQDTLYTDIDCNLHSLTKLDIFSFMLINLLKLNYQTHKNTEVNVIKEVYTKTHIGEITRYFHTKRISSSVFFILYTIFCRNIHNAE